MLGLLLTRICMRAFPAGWYSSSTRIPKLRSALTRNFVLGLHDRVVIPKLYTNFTFSGPCKLKEHTTCASGQRYTLALNTFSQTAHKGTAGFLRVIIFTFAVPRVIIFTRFLRGQFRRHNRFFLLCLRTPRVLEHL